MRQMQTVRNNAYPFFAAAVCGISLCLSVVTPRIAASSTLTIPDGVTVQAGAAGQLVIRDTLIASKSTLTSGTATPAPGDWLGLLVLGSASGTAFNGTVIEYAGSNGALQIRGASPSVSGVDIKNSSTGIKLSDGAAACHKQRHYLRQQHRDRDEWRGASVAA